MTTETVLLIIITVLLSALIIVSIAVLVVFYKLVSALRRVAQKAEDVIDSVESAAEVIKDTGGKLAIWKLVSNIIKVAQRSNKHGK